MSELSVVSQQPEAKQDGIDLTETYIESKFPQTPEGESKKAALRQRVDTFRNGDSKKSQLPNSETAW